MTQKAASTPAGILDGLAFVLIVGIAAYIWFRVRTWCCDRSCNGLQPGGRCAGGILIPPTLNRLCVESAVASSPFVTAVTGVVGFFSFPSIASLWFGLHQDGRRTILASVSVKKVVPSWKKTWLRSVHHFS